MNSSTFVMLRPDRLFDQLHPAPSPRLPFRHRPDQYVAILHARHAEGAVGAEGAAKSPLPATRSTAAVRRCGVDSRVGVRHSCRRPSAAPLVNTVRPSGSNRAMVVKLAVPETLRMKPSGWCVLIDSKPDFLALVEETWLPSGLTPSWVTSPPRWSNSSPRAGGVARLHRPDDEHAVPARRRRADFCGVNCSDVTGRSVVRRHFVQAGRRFQCSTGRSCGLRRRWRRSCRRG